MSTPIFYDADARLDLLQKKRLAFIGYGNQGAAQAQNLRDSGVQQILIGNREDVYREAAQADGFRVAAIPEASAWGDVVFLLIPDEEQPTVFREQVAPHLRAGVTLVVASGYNVAFQFLAIPEQVDVIMVAPRMIGVGVRERYLRGEAYPCFVSVERDASGGAFPLALSIARGIGATRGGAIQSSAREEAALDLFSEQALWPTIIVAFRTAYEVLHQAGFSDEAILYEMFLSKEPAEVFERIADEGLFGQLPHHSRTSQYGKLRAIAADDGAWLRERYSHVLTNDILAGKFAREWSGVQAGGLHRLEQLRAEALTSPIARAEKRLKSEKEEREQSPPACRPGSALSQPE
jgi:ketol-acid reductoisomerase